MADPASSSSFEDFLSGHAAPPAEATAVVPPPFGNVETDPALHRVAANIRRELAHQLRSSDATALDAAYRVRASGNLGEITYHPDVVVDAGEPDRAALLAKQPKVIIEIAETGSARAAFIESWHIHEQLPTVDAHVLVDPARPSVVVRRRNKSGWEEEETLSDADESVFLPTIHCMLTLETIYQDALDETDEERI